MTGESRKVAIIGLGNLGKRHLQSLKKANIPLEISLIEPDKLRLDEAISIFEGTEGFSHHKIEPHTIEEVPKVDVLICATSSRGRYQILQELIKNETARNIILEKLLFNKNIHYNDWSKFSGKEKQIWVNCPMRMMPHFESVQHNVCGEIIDYEVYCHQLGMITNSIHYIDHLAHLNGSKLIEVDVKQLSPKIIPAKRDGYSELNGKMVCRYDNGSKLVIHCDDSHPPTLKLKIETSHHKYMFNELTQMCEIMNKKTKEILAMEYKIPFQSEMTATVVLDLLRTDTCNLSPFKQSFYIHKTLMKSLHDFVKSTQNSCSNDVIFT